MKTQNDNNLTAVQASELKALATMTDKDIDYSDIPELNDYFFLNAVQNPFYKPTKKSTTIRVDQDVLQWLKADGKGYQTRINSILRDAMLKEIHK